MELEFSQLILSRILTSFDELRVKQGNLRKEANLDIMGEKGEQVENKEILWDKVFKIEYTITNHATKGFTHW